MVYARAKKARKRDFLEAMATEIRRLCIAIKIDWRAPIGHSHVETGDPATGIGWMSNIWAERGNPAGIGVEGGGNDKGFTFTDPKVAARAMVLRYALYIYGRRDDWPDFVEEALGPYVSADPKKLKMPDDYYGSVKAIKDLQGKWWEADTGASGMAAAAQKIFGDYDSNDVPAPTTNNMKKGLVALPKHTKRFISNKPNHVGWDDLGPRPTSPGHWRQHRMQGSLWGTDEFFRQVSTPALTDVGIDHQTGEMIIWIPWWNTRITPWASGPVKAPYGDAACSLDNNPYPSVGVSLANFGGVSCELSGFFRQPGTSVQQDSPWSLTSKKVLAQAIASVAHDGGITWQKFPYDQDGCSMFTWHEEWIGKPGDGVPSDSKHCPGDVVMAATNEILGMAKDILEHAQGGSVQVPPPVVVPPAQALVYPAGVNEDVVSQAFGKVTFEGYGYSFNPEGAVSRLYLDLAYALTKSGAPVQFPRLEEVAWLKNNGDKNLYFFFSNGWIIYKENGKLAKPVISGLQLGGEENKA
jgi:hypothetical protein